MAAAQENLDKRRKEAPEENFDIENVDDCEKVIEMVSIVLLPCCIKVRHRDDVSSLILD